MTRIYPIAILTAIVALGGAVLFGEHRAFAQYMSISALVLLLEPIVFLCLMLIPLITDFDSESGAAFLVFVLFVLLPLSLPVSALWLARRRQYAIS